MASFAAFIDVAIGALKLCNKCYKCCAEEKKDKEDEEKDSEDGSASEENTKTKNKSNAAKTRKKRGAEYKPVKQNEPSETTTTTQPQAQPIATQTLSTVISPIINITYPANIPELPGIKSGPSTSASSRCGEGIVQWIPSSTRKAIGLLKKAVVAGIDIDRSKLWIIRTVVEGEMTLGKLNTKHSLAFVAYRQTDTYVEANVTDFEVFCVPPEHRHRIIWIHCCDGSVPKNAILASTKDSEKPLYIGRKLHVDKEKKLKSLCPGMIHPDRGLWITFDFKVYQYDTFEVMCLE